MGCDYDYGFSGRYKLMEEKMSEQKIYVGDIAKDTVTGFQGMAVARTEWLNGCVRITIQPQELKKDGGTIEPEHFDEQQLAMVKKGPQHKLKAVTGGPQKDHVIMKGR
jgi:hypothetical protein